MAKCVVEIKEESRGAVQWKGCKDIAYIRFEGYFLRLCRLACGKSNCTKCPHGPYWYFGYTKRRKVKQIYLGRSLLGERALRHPEILEIVKEAQRQKGIPAVAVDAELELLRRRELNE
jgi:hypothetical protein